MLNIYRISKWISHFFQKVDNNKMREMVGADENSEITKKEKQPSRIHVSYNCGGYKSVKVA